MREKQHDAKMVDWKLKFMIEFNEWNYEIDPFSVVLLGKFCNDFFFIKSFAFQLYGK
jgi:hypothetical protein